MLVGRAICCAQLVLHVQQAAPGCSALFPRAMVPRPRANTRTTRTTRTTISCSVTTGHYGPLREIRTTCKFVMEVCKLCGFFRESSGSFERNSISSYFDKFLEANTLGVLLGILLNFFMMVMFLLECTYLLFSYVFSPVTHTSPTYKGSRESWWSMMNWLKLQGIQIHSEYHFAAPRCLYVEQVCCF
jgi:hypothetical protein